MDIRSKGMESNYQEDPGIIFHGNTYIPTFDSMKHDPIAKYLTKEDIMSIYTLTKDPNATSGNMTERFNVYDAIMKPRGFIRHANGTNRIIYRYTLDNSFIIKIALDDVGINDNKAELKNQEFLKPFVPKVYDVTPCGVLQMMEKVDVAHSMSDLTEEFGTAMFTIINDLISGGVILEDIGSDFPMNWGFRAGFGLVLLDFPYAYRLNTERLRCTQLYNGERCQGHIRYDEGYNTLTCDICGERYPAKVLGTNYMLLKQRREGRGLQKDEGLVVRITKNGHTYVRCTGMNQSDVVNERASRKPMKHYKVKKMAASL